MLESLTKPSWYSPCLFPQPPQLHKTPFSKHMWPLTIPKPATLSSAFITSHMLFPLFATPFPQLHSLPPSLTPASFFIHHFYQASLPLVKSILNIVDAHSPWFHNIQGVSSTKYLSHWTTVINWLLCCLYLTKHFEDRNCILCFIYLCISNACTCQRLGIRNMFVIWMNKGLGDFGILFLPSNFWMSHLSTHIHYLDREAKKTVGSVKDKLQTLEEEMVRKAIYGPLWFTNCPHFLKHSLKPWKYHGEGGLEDGWNRWGG